VIRLEQESDGQAEKDSRLQATLTDSREVTMALQPTMLPRRSPAGHWLAGRGQDGILYVQYRKEKERRVPAAFLRPYPPAPMPPRSRSAGGGGLGIACPRGRTCRVGPGQRGYRQLVSESAGPRRRVLRPSTNRLRFLNHGGVPVTRTSGLRSPFGARSSIALLHSGEPRFVDRWTGNPLALSLWTSTGGSCAGKISDSHQSDDRGP
jgi:hypothetical protein